ncbi:plasmid recombination protein [Janthinobacterium sp. J1-1]|jgi:hypothetical protein|uniref:plasmid recombination protein n=1 Tax=Janthinobacterium sp. J1-1 TaxID=3065910 RepID=UPI002811A865|nr:plasmid recombination protein [Janthinobacterium sp. J1-1]
MMHAQFLRIKKLTGKAIIEVAARHNCREIVAELGAKSDGRIDPTRVSLNRVLRGHGTAAAVASEAQALMDAAGIKVMRKDAVRALEIIFSLPSDSPIDHDCFFNESAQWAGQYFAAPVISAIVHNDEAAPHCHVLLLPLVNGRMVGSDLMGGRAKLQAMQADFYGQIGQRYGLARQTAQKRPSAATRQQAIDSAFDVLEANSGLSAAVLLALLTPHLGNPAPLLLALGLTMPTPTAVKGDFVKMMTKPCKPGKPIGFGKKKPIGFDGSTAPEKGQTLSCVGFAKFSPSFPPPNEPQQATQDQPPAPAIAITDSASIRREEMEPFSMSSTASSSPKMSAVTATHPQPTGTEGDYQRERDDERPAGQWSEALGEFIKPTVKASCKSAVIASVRVALEGVGRQVESAIA